MNIDAIKGLIPDFAKDVRLNFGRVVSLEGAIGLNQVQIDGIVLSCAYATKHSALIAAVEEDDGSVSGEVVQGAREAASVMAMNNIYYRFVHLLDNDIYSQMPAGLRMNVIANPSVSKVDFELNALAVSIINGCGMCIKAHVKQLEAHGMQSAGIQSCARIAAVMNAVAQVIVIDKGSQ